MSSKKRSFVKAVSWRVIATTTTMLIVYMLTNDFRVMTGIGILDILFKTAVYYMHERIWNTIKWGRDDNSHNHDI